MVCDTRIDLSAQGRQRMQEALERLRAGLADGTMTAVIGANGALAFKGWTDNGGYSDTCAYRALSARNSPELRRAIARAEVTSGRSLNPRAVASGTHSHDGGRTWTPGHQH
jgi:hypothetical protein